MRRIYLPAILMSFFGLLLLLLSFTVAVPRIHAQTTGTDWIGQFYNSGDLSGSPVNTGLFPTGLNQNWGVNSPTDGLGTTISGVNADNWSARFTTTENIAAGLYEFVLVADDGARVYVDGNLVLDTFDNTGLVNASVVLSLSGGVYTIIVDYRDVTGAAVLQLSWFTSQPTVEVTATPIPLAKGTVDGNRVRGLALRTGPYLGASLINVLRPGKTYDITAQNFSEGIYTWYQVVVPTTGQTGWASGRYLDVTAPTNTTVSCQITEDLALTAIQVLLPQYQDAVTAFQCVNSVNQGDASGIVLNCGTIIAQGTVGNVIDAVSLGLAVDQACATQTTTTQFSIATIGSVFDTIDGAPDLGVIGVTRSVMNFRVRPSQRAFQISDIPQIFWGAEVSILGRTVQEGEDFWYQVRFGDRVGWILASYVRIRSGDINRVPIY